MKMAGRDLAQRVETRAMSWDLVYLVQGAIIIGIVALLYGSIMTGTVADWIHDPNYSHGFLVPAFSGVVVWQKRKELSQLVPKPSWFGLVVITASLAILIVGVFGVEFFLQRTSLVLLIAGLVIYFFGWRHLRLLWFPLAFLLFMIPLPTIVFNQIAFPLQSFAARLASTLLDLSGVPVLRDGNIIHLPTISLEVAQACSGIRSLLSLGALAVIYGYFLETQPVRRFSLALASIPIAVVANGLRIAGTGLLGYYWDPDKAEGFFHTFSGWVIFVVAILMLFLFHGLIRWLGGRRHHVRV
jgi:exosortase